MINQYSLIYSLLVVSEPTYKSSDYAVSDKHFSLFVPFVSDGGKSFITFTMLENFFLIHQRCHKQNKQECLSLTSQYSLGYSSQVRPEPTYKSPD
jgi:hypothetical protein